MKTLGSRSLPSFLLLVASIASPSTVSAATSGTLWVWGNNDHGQLGDGTTVNRTFPIQSGSANNWVAVSGGVHYSLGLRSDGTLWAWGYNSVGQLGTGTTADSLVPVRIGSETWLAVSGSAGSHSLGIKSDGTLWAWGANDFGQLGDGTKSNRTSPVQVGSDNEWVAVSGGQFHTLGLKSDGSLWAWGRNDYGQLGDGTIMSRNVPVQIGSENRWVAIVAGSYHSLGLKSDGTLWAWGCNSLGQQFGMLGDGSTVNKSYPIKVGTDNNWKVISAGHTSSVGIKSDGTLWVWGGGHMGELGLGDYNSRTSPVQLGTDNNWLAVAAKNDTTHALKSDGTLWGWGDSTYGQLGDGTNVRKLTPVQIASDKKWVAPGRAFYHALAIKSDEAIPVPTPNPGGESLEVTAHVPGKAPAVVPNGGSFTLPAQGVGKAVSAWVSLRNTSYSTTTVTGISLAGSSDFSLTVLPPLPSALAFGGSVSFIVTFTPTSAEKAVAYGVITTTEGSETRNYRFEVNGAVPELAAGYFFEPSGSVQNLSSGQTVRFKSTNLQSSTTLVVIVSNRGSASGELRSVGLAGEPDYELSALPSLPATIEPGQSLRFKVTFTPRAEGTRLATLAMGVNADRLITAYLEGVGANASMSISYTLASNSNSMPLSEGGRLSFAPVPVNGSATATVAVSNDGTGSGTVESVALTGDAFEATGLPVFPATVQAGGELRFTVRFRPKDEGQFTGNLSIRLNGQAVGITVEGSTSPAEFRLSYLDPLTSNSIPLTEGAVLSFPETRLNVLRDITVVLANRGTGGGKVEGAAIEGSSTFMLMQLPIFPYTVNANSELRFVVRFTPTERKGYSATLRIQIPGQPITIRMEGRAQQIEYHLITAEATQEVIGGQQVPFPDVEVGKKSELILRVRNAGATSAQVSSVLLNGTSFSVSDTPFLPVTLASGDSFQMTLKFAPTEPGKAQAYLRIGDDTVTLTGTGLGSKLEYTFAASDSITPVVPGDSVILGTVPVGEQSSAEFTVRNTGNRAAPVFAIAVLANSKSAPFRLADLPDLPLNLEPDQTLRFTVRFRPDNVGTATMNLGVNNSAFALAGTGLPPAKLPRYGFSGANGPQDPLQQPPVGLYLEEPYPLTLRGALTLNFTSDVLSRNPAVRFETGSTVAYFLIPAGSTDAVFENSASAIRLQTGTLAGDLVITPVLQTESGYDLSGDSPSRLTMTVAKAVPKLLEARIESVTQNGFQIAVRGYTTTRSLRQLTIQLTPHDAKMSNGSVSADIRNAADLWFMGASSEAYGGLFSVYLPLYLNGGDKPVSHVGSVTVAITNELGSSNTITVPMP